MIFVRFFSLVVPFRIVGAVWVFEQFPLSSKLRRCTESSLCPYVHGNYLHYYSYVTNIKHHNNASYDDLRHLQGSDVLADPTMTGSGGMRRNIIKCQHGYTYNLTGFFHSAATDVRCMKSSLVSLYYYSGVMPDQYNLSLTIADGLGVR